MLRVGSHYNESFLVTQDQVDQYALLSGDHNPIHLDEEYAAQSIFGRRIVHGFLACSVFTKVLGTSFPGPGTIYLKQDLVFKQPCYTNQEYKAQFEIMSIDADRHRAIVSTTLLDHEGKEIIAGQALVQNSQLL